MRLLKWNDWNKPPSLSSDLTNNLPAYAILSHTWTADEVTFADLQPGQNQYRSKAGYEKIRFCGEQARRDGIEYVWVDTCCIDKANNSELTEAITSMYQWYKAAQKCYVYLPDVSTCASNNHSGGQLEWQSSFRASRWFTRGWTLQELLAPTVVEFYSREGDLIGTKQTLIRQIHEATSIPLAALEGTPLSQFSIAERIRWTERRQTSKREDQAYCLLGIFDVFMPLIYGEGDNALRRLQREINEQYGVNVAAALSASDQIQSLGLCLSSAPVISPGDFIGRTVEIDTVHGLLRSEKAPREQCRVALGGIGGIGKTQLAIAYARQYQRSYTSILWLNATSELTLYASFRQVAQTLVTADELERLNDKQALARIHYWLSRSDNQRWLLIFDNYDEPDQFNISSFYPSVGHGSVIITTRLPDLVNAQQVRVQPLKDISNNLAILQLRSGRNEVQTDPGAHRLAQRLSGLPLALATAGAYLRKSTITFQQYLDIYEQRWQVDARRPLPLREYQDNTLYTTWNLSYSRLKNEDADAAQMLKLLAYFDNQEVWYELLHAGSSDNNLPEWLQASLDDWTSFDSVIGTLFNYCLVEIQHANKSYSIHSCVHDWTLGKLNIKIDPVLYWYAVDCVFKTIDKDDWDVLGQVKYARVSRHGVRLAHHRFGMCDESEGDSLECQNKVIWIARLLKEQVQLLAAEQMYLRALAGLVKAFGPDYNSTLYTLNHLGILYWNQGRFDEAERMYLRALAGYDKALGPDHTSTLGTVNNLGILYWNQGKLDMAEQMYLRALAKYREVLGSRHTSTFDTINNLGILYRDQGRFDEAERMYLHVLAGREAVLGLEHTSTLDTVNNLGVLYRSQGRLDEAEQMYLRALTGRHRTLGPDHTLTRGTIRNLGILYWYQGRLDEAEQMLGRAVPNFDSAWMRDLV